MVKFLGFEIKRENQPDQKISSFIEPTNSDGALNIGGAVGGAYGLLFDIEGSIKSEGELVTRYREMMNNSEIQQAVDEIVNEVVVVDSHEDPIKLNLDKIKLSPKIKTQIENEFGEVLKLLDFSNNAYDIVSKFYVDGRLNFHILIDENRVTDGIKEIRYIDPRKIKLIREYENRQNGIPVNGEIHENKIKQEYFLYSEMGFSSGINQSGSYSGSTGGIRIAKDSVVRVTSGLLNENGSMVLSHIGSAYKPLNQLRTLEDANLIYTLTRAPERRIFYVDVGNLPKAKAEQYLYDMMARHKNKVTYDPTTGQIKDDRKMMTMTEDFWFPRREGSRSTEIDTLPAGTGLGSNENIPYFQNKLYKSLNVPIARLQPETMYSFGRSNETTREELKFAKFIRRIRSKFSNLFDETLKRQIILKGILTPSEWDDIKNDIKYNFAKDNYFEELKEMEILREKLGMLRDIEENVGKYFSRKWIKHNILYQSDQEIDEMQKQMDQEMEELPPEDDQDVDKQSNGVPPQQEELHEIVDLENRYQRRMKQTTRRIP